MRSFITGPAHGASMIGNRQRRSPAKSSLRTYGNSLARRNRRAALERECHVANNKVTKFGLKAATPIETDLDGWKKVAGNPTMKTWIEYSADDGSSISGWWGATPGT